MLAGIRHTKIIEILNTKGSVKVAELSKKLDVTEKTIREDLEKLDHAGLLKRVHGGAILTENEDSMLPIRERRKKHLTEKELIAIKAFEQINDGQTILIDGGSTTLKLAELLVNRSVTVITNDIKISNILSKSETINLIVVGGYLRKGTTSLIGANAVQMIKNFHVDLSFIGASGVDINSGLTIFSMEEAELKKAMLEASKYTILLADHTKFNRVALVSFATIQQVDEIITDSQTDSTILSKFQALEIKITQTTSENIKV